jgi:hypothetical protein
LLADSFATADVFAVSSRSRIHQPSKLYGILAMAGHVASVEKASEVAQITAKHGCGLLAEPGDPDDLARKILTLYHDRALAERLAAAARKAALEYDRPTQVRAYEALLREVHAEWPAPRFKRLFDVTISGLGLLGAAPLAGLIAAAIKLDDGGPVLYGQERVGRRGRRFSSWKFRSMAPTRMPDSVRCRRAIGTRA